MPKSQNHQNHDNLTESFLEAGRISKSQCWGRQRSSMACWSSSRLPRLFLLAGEIVDFRRHFDTPFLMKIPPSFWKSCLNVFNCGRCKRSELDEVLQTSLAALQLVLAQESWPNPSLCAFSSSFFFLPFSWLIWWFREFHQNLQIKEQNRTFSKEYLGCQGQAQSLIKAQLQRMARGCSGLSGDDWHRRCPCVAVVPSWSWKISNFVFLWFQKSAAAVSRFVA